MICAKAVAHSFSNANMQGQRGQELKVKIRINVPVRVNPVQITALYSHSSRKTKPDSNTKRNPIRIHVYP